MRLLEELGIPELVSEQIEELSLIAEEAARKYVLSKVPLKKIEALNITAETKGAKPVKLKVEVDIVLSPSMRNFNVQMLGDEAIKEAFHSAEKYLREITCPSPK